MRPKLHRRKTPIIVISLEEIGDEAKRAGADAFLRKPNNLIELVDTIRRLLEARTEASSPSSAPTEGGRPST